MTTESTYGRYSAEKYQKKWKTVNITSETKELLQELAKHLSTDIAEVPMSSVLDKLITDKHNELFKK